MMLLKEEEKSLLGARIKVMGVGGGGGNAVNSMIEQNDLHAVEYIVANTDAQVLTISQAPIKIQLGEKITKGLGAGSNPDMGRRSAEEDLEAITHYIADADILFLAVGLGGGTGTGATPVIARAARELGILTVAVATKPFVFEGLRRTRQAEEAITLLKKEVDTLIVIPNNRLLEIADEKISMLDAFALVNNVLKQAIKGISDIITHPGHINVDFADVRCIMKGMGMALMGVGRATGENRAKQAAMSAISSSLLEDVDIKGARGVLINISGNKNLGLHEINNAAELIYSKASPDANIILGSVIDPNMGDEIMVTVIATGFDGNKKERDDVSYVRTVGLSTPTQAVQPMQEKKAPDFVEAAQKNISMPRQYQDADAKSDFHDLDTPTFLREQTRENSTE